MEELQENSLIKQEKEDKKEEFKLKLNALELKLIKIKNFLINQVGKKIGEIEDDGKMKLSQREFEKIFDKMISSEIDESLIPFERQEKGLKLKDDAIVEINNELADIDQKGLIGFEELDMDLDLGTTENSLIDFEKDEEEVLTGETSGVSIKKEIASKNKLKEDDIVSVIVIKDKEDASYLFKENLNVPGQVKIVRDINDNCIIVNDENEKIMGYEATEPAMELIDKLNLYRHMTAEIDHDNIDRGRTEGQDFDDIIMIRNENHPNVQWLIANGPNDQRNAEIFEIKDYDEIRQIDAITIFPADKNIELSDRKIDIKKSDEKINSVYEIERTGQGYTDLLRQELIETQKRIDELKKLYDGTEVDASTAGEVMSEMKMLTDKMKFLQTEFSKTENTRLDLQESDDLAMEIKDEEENEEKENDEYEHIKVPWPTE